MDLQIDRCTDLQMYGFTDLGLRKTLFDRQANLYIRKSVNLSICKS